MSNGMLDIQYDVEKRREQVRNLSFQILGPGDFEIKDANGKVVQKLKLSFNGSDGMSDSIYPYEAQWLPKRSEPAAVLYGGCTSERLLKRE
jgi:hypothetical protein